MSDANASTQASDDFARYHRQMLLQGIGEAGQAKISQATALIIGCGALGTTSAQMLVRAGVGHVILVDRDVVEETNLQRQVLFDENDAAAATPKAIAAAQRLEAINHQVRITPIVEHVDPLNIETIAGVTDTPESQPVDVIVDGVDNFETRFLLNDVAVKYGIPYIYGGAVGTSGAAMTILPRTPDEQAPWEQVERDGTDQPTNFATPDLRDVFEEAPPPGLAPTCDTVGVLGPVVSLIANVQASEALKVITGNWSAVSRSMLSVDLWQNSFRQIDVSRFAESSSGICSKQRRFEYLEEGKGMSRTIKLCGRNAVQITRQPDRTGARQDRQENDASNLAIKQLANRLSQFGDVQSNPLMLRAHITVDSNPYEFTVFQDGRAIIRGTEDVPLAQRLYAQYIGN